MTTATMDPRHAVESVQTLRFAETCAKVRNQGSASTAASVQAALNKVAEQITNLEKVIIQKERWETRLIRRRDVDTVAGAFGEGEKVVREEMIPTTVLVGAEHEREQLELLLQRQSDLQGLAGGLGSDFRDLRSQEAADGGRGVDFRERDRFTKCTRARDFENEIVVADALRFFFRKAAAAIGALGETPETAKRRLSTADMPPAYLDLARSLRATWEGHAEVGIEKRSFGKAMLDQCNAWSEAFKANAADEGIRRGELQRLLSGEVELHSCDSDDH